MSIRSVQVHALLLAVLLAAAWMSVHKDDTPAPKTDDIGVVLVSAAEGEAEAIEYVSEKRTLRIESAKDERGRWFRGSETIKETAAPKEKADDEGAPDDAAPEPVVEAKTEVFHAGRTAESLWEHLEPLKAVRVLDKLTDEKKEELGLNETVDTLKVTVRGKDHSFQLGGKAYGTSDQYALADDGRAVVLPRNLTSNLTQGAQPFRERRLFDINRPDLTSATFTDGTRTLEIEQHDGSGMGQSFWARAGQEQGQVELKAAVDKLYAVQAKGYEADVAGDLILTVTVKNDEGEDDTLKVFSSIGPEGTVTYLVRSGHSRLPATVDPKRVDELQQVLNDLY